MWAHFPEQRLVIEPRYILIRFGSGTGSIFPVIIPEFERDYFTFLVVSSMNRSEKRFLFIQFVQASDRVTNSSLFCQELFQCLKDSAARPHIKFYGVHLGS